MIHEDQISFIVNRKFSSSQVPGASFLKLRKETQKLVKWVEIREEKLADLEDEIDHLEQVSSEMEKEIGLKQRFTRETLRNIDEIQQSIHTLNALRQQPQQQSVNSVVVEEKQLTAQEQQNQCAVCKIRPITHAIVPCGHFVSCTSCAPSFRSVPKQKPKNCPKCNKRSTQALKIWK